MRYYSDVNNFLALFLKEFSTVIFKACFYLILDKNKNKVKGMIFSFHHFTERKKFSLKDDLKYF